MSATEVYGLLPGAGQPEEHLHLLPHLSPHRPLSKSTQTECSRSSPSCSWRCWRRSRPTATCCRVSLDCFSFFLPLKNASRTFFRCRRRCCFSASKRGSSCRFRELDCRSTVCDGRLLMFSFVPVGKDKLKRRI